jgi:hypothetical protein
VLVPGTAPPYALETVPLHFPALAQCAGRAPLGGDRDLILGVFVAARLAVALLPPVRLDMAAASGRAERAKAWLAGLTMPQPGRMATLRVIEATVAGPGHAAESLAELARTVVGHIDTQAQQELSDLVAQLRLYYEQTP